MNAKEMRAEIARLQKELPKQEDRERMERLGSVSVTIGAEGQTNPNRYSVRVSLNGHDDRRKVHYGTRAECDAYVRRILTACEKCLQRRHA
jgi:hypothetical protein